MNIAFVVSSVPACLADGGFWEVNNVNYKYFLLSFIIFSWLRVIYLQNSTEVESWLCWKLLSVFTPVLQVLLCSRRQFSFSVWFCIYDSFHCMGHALCIFFLWYNCFFFPFIFIIWPLSSRNNLSNSRRGKICSYMEKTTVCWLQMYSAKLKRKSVTSNNPIPFPTEVAQKRSHLWQIYFWPHYSRYFWVNFQCCVHLAMHAVSFKINRASTAAFTQPWNCSPFTSFCLRLEIFLISILLSPLSLGCVCIFVAQIRWKK